MIQTELYFGLYGPQGERIADTAFAAFVRAEISPAFPQGYTLLQAQGQWRMADGTLMAEPSRVLRVLHPRGHSSSAQLDSIADRYCRRFDQEAVLRISRRVRASFPDG